MKNRKEKRNIQPQILQNLLSPRELKEVILERCKNAALAFGVELLEQEVERLCGHIVNCLNISLPNGSRKQSCLEPWNPERP